MLTLHVRLAGVAVPDAQRRECLAMVGLAGRGDDRVGGFSKGMQQRLGLAVVLVARPQFVVLDEPTSALDPLGRADVRDIVLDLRSRGVAVLLNSHLIGEVERVCDPVVVLDRGRVAAAGSLAELLGQRELRLHLTGLTAAAEERLVQTGSVHKEGDWLTVAVPAEDESAAPDLVRDLVGLGVSVHAVEPVRISLEGTGCSASCARAPRTGRHGREHGGRAMTTVLTVAALTVREASRRRVVLALGVLTLALVGLSTLGFSRLAGESLTSGEARLIASILLNLVMFGFSLIAALGTAFLAGLDAGRGDRSRAPPCRCWPGRSVGRRSCWARRWAWSPSAAGSSSSPGWPRSSWWG